MASPHVAALAGMIRGVNPTLTNEEIMGLIRSTATDLGDAGHDIYYGHGQIDIEQALMAERSSGQTKDSSGEQLPLETRSSRFAECARKKDKHSRIQV